MRFRALASTHKRCKYMTYASITRVLGITYNDVQHICRQALKQKKPAKLKVLVR